MFSYYEENIITETFAGLLGIAGCSLIHLNAVTEIIWNSSFVKELDKRNCKELLNKTSLELFEELFSDDVDDNFYKPENLQQVVVSEQYKRFYWCGWAYMQLYFEYNKPLSYLMLIIPMQKMEDIYPVYHEMDVTQLFLYYEDVCFSSTIMRRISSYRKISANKLSGHSGVNINTINYYKKSDVNLYKASFQNVYALCLSLHVPPGMFLETTISKNEE